MDRIIMKNADNINLLYPEMPAENVDPHQQGDMKTRYDKKKKRWREEDGGVQEQLLDGRGGEDRSQFRGMGTDNSYGIPGSEGGL